MAETSWYFAGGFAAGIAFTLVCIWYWGRDVRFGPFK